MGYLSKALEVIAVLASQLSTRSTLPFIRTNVCRSTRSLMRWTCEKVVTWHRKFFYCKAPSEILTVYSVQIANAGRSMYRAIITSIILILTLSSSILTFGGKECPDVGDPSIWGQ